MCQQTYKNCSFIFKFSEKWVHWKSLHAASLKAVVGPKGVNYAARLRLGRLNLIIGFIQLNHLKHFRFCCEIISITGASLHEERQRS